jgi:uncharacterized protein
VGRGEKGRERPAVQGVIDCDIHCVVPSVDVLLPYLPAYWQEQIAISGFKGPVDEAYPASAATSVRPGAALPDGTAGSSLALLRTQVLEPWRVEWGVLNCAYAIESIHNPDAAIALASAVNDWQIASWLDQEPRLRASIVVPSQLPDAAAAEIDRRAADERFVQVWLPVRAAAPYGNRRYWPIFEAATRHNLAVGIGFGGAPGTPPMPSGWPSTYLEEYAGMASVFQSQLMSLICEGVFDRFPDLRVVLIEGGFTWLPSFLWRLDKEWKALRREVPWVRRLPAEYVHEHVRFTLQPLDGPPDERQFREVIAQLGADDLLLFSTDYPHWHFDKPEAALPPVEAPLLAKILRDNALAFYRPTPIP